MEDRRQSALEIVDKLVHRIVEFSRTAGRQLDGDRSVRIGEIVDIDPVGRTGLAPRLFGQDGLDGILHAGAVRADDKEIEAGLADLRSEADRFEGARLTDKPVDRLQFCRR